MKNKSTSLAKMIFSVLILAITMVLGNGVIKADTLENIMGSQAVPKENHIISYEPKISSSQVQKRSAIVTNYAFHSKVLKLDWNYDVYLPAGYDPKAAKKYPVIYLLHGFLNNHGDMWNKMNTQKMLNQVQQRTGQPMIAVFVDGFNSWYINSPDPGGMQMQTAIINDLMPDVEKNYRVSKKASQTAVGGLSMGGYGAARLALKYPNEFSSVMAYSPAIYRKVSDQDQDTLIAFANKKGKGLAKNYRKYYPTRHFKQKAQSVKFYVETSRDDTVVNVKDVSAFVKTLKKKDVSVKYLQDSGYDHGWALWDKTFPQGYQWVAQQFADSK
ncbi:esterase [Ligilactobacillus salitolerans]|uniref:Esterase n=1 Tax=Ligilactobacillus salitolerans TaxID=1808352 RepID=A0A401IRP4_9LACO|nr:alpha/beta hydrolase-fold protein [Ligilactobacillus salitolerans]GBG94187.1 esterase [Ligilactobacillus salitolerans]